MKLRTICAITASVLAWSIPASHAQQSNKQAGSMDCQNMQHMHDMKDMKNMKMDCDHGQAAQASLADGEVAAIDKAGSKVTLKHGPIKSKTVQMPGMTMAFPVQKPVLLAKLKKGDKVKFNVEDINGTATVTSIQVVK